jgi:hypothetical protein
MNNFEVLVGMTNGFVQRWFRDNSQTTPSNFLQAPWMLSGRDRPPFSTKDGFPGTPTTHVSMIVNRLGALEAVVVTPPNGELQHWIQDPSDGTWGLGSAFPNPPPVAIGPPSLIQGTYGSGNLELLVPTQADQFGNGHVIHFWLDKSNPGAPWIGPTKQFAPGALYVALIQSDYGDPVPPGDLFGGPGNLECVVVGGPDDEMNHWWRDNGDWKWSWTITNLNSKGGAAGCPAMVGGGGGSSSNFHADFHVIVPTNFTPPTLAHYARDNSPDGGAQWSFVEDLGPALDFGIYPALITSSDFQSRELVVGGNSTALVHFRQSLAGQSLAGGDWTQTATFASNNGGGAVGFVELKEADVQ